MLTFLNQKLRFLLVFVLFVIGISFVFFGSWTPNREQAPTGAIGMIEGRGIRYDDFVAAQKAALVMHAFQTGQLIERDDQDEDWIYQTWLQLVALAAAKEANIQIMDEDVVNAIRSNLIFQENGKYSPELFQKFFQYFLTPQGVTADRFQEMVRDELTIETLFKQITSTAMVSPVEVEDLFERLFGKAEVAVVSFSLNQIKQSLKPTKAELEDFYKTNASTYVTLEKRKVEYVEFKLTTAEQKLSEAEKSKALSRLGEKVFEFIGNLTASEGQAKMDFKEAAAKYNVAVQTADFITQEQSFLPQYKQPDLTRIVFDLDKENSVSDYVPFGDGYLVFHLAEVKPSAPISFQEAQKQVQEDFVHQKSMQSLRKQAMNFEKEIKAKLASGVSWEKAVGELKQKSANLPAFAPADEGKLKVESPHIVRALGQRLAVGQASGFVPTPTGGMIVYLRNRLAPSEAKRKEVFAKIQENLLRQRKEQLVQEWFHARLNRPKTRIPDKLLKNFER